MHLSPDFRELAESFLSREVRFLIGFAGLAAVGAHALAVHGHPRYTGDVDVWTEPTPENAARVVAALSDFGFGGVGLTAADFSMPDQVVHLGYPPNRIDLLTGRSGVTFEACYPGRMVVDAGGLTLPVIGRDCLRANKRATGRPQDLADLDALGPDDNDP